MPGPQTPRPRSPTPCPSGLHPNLRLPSPTPYPSGLYPNLRPRSPLPSRQVLQAATEAGASLDLPAPSGSGGLPPLMPANSQSTTCPRSPLLSYPLPNEQQVPRPPRSHPCLACTHTAMAIMLLRLVAKVLLEASVPALSCSPRSGDTPTAPAVVLSSVQGEAVVLSGNITTP